MTPTTQLMQGQKAEALSPTFVHDSLDEVMTVDEVAACLKIQPKTVYEWAKSGRLPGHKIGRFWRFLRGEIEAFLKGGSGLFCYNAQTCRGVERMEVK